MNEQPRMTPRSRPLDVIGIGFGPANLSLAIALREGAPGLTTLFLEKSPAFTWHGGMLLPDAQMQVSFLKDLANLRNPRSHFTFVNYLFEKDRLVNFTNLKRFYPTRVEFHDYLSWCAEHFADITRYGHTVERITLDRHPVTGEPLYRVTAHTAMGEKTFLARAVVHSCGLKPVLPAGIEAGPRIFHNIGLLHRLEALNPPAHARFMVAGAGQSAAEVVEYLVSTGRAAHVTAVVSRYGYMPADNSPFVNQVFDPEFEDFFHGLPPKGRQMVLRTHANTNYAAVDLEVIERLYSLWYQDKVQGRERFLLKRLCVVDEARQTGEGVTVTTRNVATGQRETQTVDYLICATGFRPHDPLALLGTEIADITQLDDAGLPVVDRTHRVRFTKPGLPPFFTVGTAEQTIGLTDTLISNMAVRAGMMAEALDQALSLSVREESHA